MSGRIVWVEGMFGGRLVGESYGWTDGGKCLEGDEWGNCADGVFGGR